MACSNIFSMTPQTETLSTLTSDFPRPNDYFQLIKVLVSSDERDLIMVQKSSEAHLFKPGLGHPATGKPSISPAFNCHKYQIREG